MSGTSNIPTMASWSIATRRSSTEEVSSTSMTLLLIGRRLITEHDWIRRAIKARYPILAIDEYQDLGVPLHEIVLALLESGTRILAVGDPNQSIYGFTGAQPHLLESLAECPDVEVAQLRFNYRCGKRIVATSNVTLPRATGEVARSDHEGLIDWHECPEGIEQQADYICSTLLGGIIARNPGVTLGDIACSTRPNTMGMKSQKPHDAPGSTSRVSTRTPHILRLRSPGGLNSARPGVRTGGFVETRRCPRSIRTWVRCSLARRQACLSSERSRMRLVQTLVRTRDSELPLSNWLCTMEWKYFSRFSPRNPRFAKRLRRLQS